ncbi:MAG TPA: hypothetical protein VKY74_17545, partial [Chloroflexia bacterium]|nr:hypothetical protein [Chloroflexia bacterium]
LPRNVRRELEFIWVDDMDQVLIAILAPLAAESLAIVPGSQESASPVSAPLVAGHDLPAPAAPTIQPPA